MKRITRKIKQAKSKLFYSRPVYVPGYTYSPVRRYAVIALIPLTMLALIAIAINQNKNLARLFGGNGSNTTGIEQTKETKQQDDAEKTPYYSVVRVIDGDTIVVNIAGKDETLRLIGINTPETQDPRKPVECFGREASAKMEDLVSGKQVALESDPTQSDRDKYNRLLRYVFLGDGTHIGREMISNGYAYEYTYLVPYKYQNEFKNAQKEAEENALGLWSVSTCAGGAAGEQTEESSNTSPTASADRAEDCDPNYVPCIPKVTYDLDCADINTQVQVVGSDIHRFDRNGDGYGCEAYN